LDAGKIIDKLGKSVSFYKIGLGMLTGGGLALANELKENGLVIHMLLGQQLQAEERAKQKY